MSVPSLAAAILGWLHELPTRRATLPHVFEELAARLRAGGISLRRIRTSITTKHPEIFARIVEWHAHRGAMVKDGARELLVSAGYRTSPVARIHAGTDRIRCRLRGPDADLSYEITRELAADGMTDYLLHALVFSSGERTYLSFATDAEGGFDDEALAVLDALIPALTTRIEIDALSYAQESLLRVYLGNNAAKRVLEGAFLRGTGEPIRAALWFCDMRGFTTLADRRPATEVVTILDQFFEAVAGPIAPKGGEVLKFIGDAVLAVFPVGDTGPSDACARALSAAREARTAVAELAARDGMPPLGLGIALHLGEVVYGNIGARERLDFTVIGAAVNEVCRVEALCRELGPILMTADFALHCEAEAESRGIHALKGVAAPQELFAPR